MPEININLNATHTTLPYQIITKQKRKKDKPNFFRQYKDKYTNAVVSAFLLRFVHAGIGL